MKKTAVLLIALLSALGVLAFFLLPRPAEAPMTPSFAGPVLTADEIPAYAGLDAIEVNGGVPGFESGQLSAAPYVVFSPLDALGRTGAGMACLGRETLPTRPRGEIGEIRPSGWHTVRYDDLIEDRYLYNRCHVIAYMLCGDDGTPENLFTGTRRLNAETMLPYEIKVGDYIEKTGNHVLYRVTPLYRDRDLLAAGVQMEALSVEDGGAGICFNVFVYNVQPGVRIDYRTGESERDPDEPPPGEATQRGEGGRPSRIEIPFFAAEAAFAALWLLLRVLVWTRRKRIDGRREALLLLMYINLAVILRFTFFPLARAAGGVQPLILNTDQIFPLRINWIPFVRLRDYRRTRDLLFNSVGNFALFVPTGILLPTVYRRLDGFGKTLAAGAGLSLCVELLQLPFAVRATDADDLILNTLGVAAGYGIWAAIRSLQNRKRARPR